MFSQYEFRLFLQPVLKLALNHSVAPLPVDTTVQVRPASVLGLTYVDLVPGHSARPQFRGATRAISSTPAAVR